MSTLGVDLGTSGVRAVSYDDAGRELAAARRNTALRRPAPGLVVVDAESMLRVVEDLVAEVAAATTRAGADPIRAVSFSSMGEAVVPVDRQGRAVDLAPVGLDARGENAARAVAARIGPERVQQITGQPLHRMFSVYLAAGSGPAWRPPVAVAYRTCADFVATRWGAEPVTDWSAAARTGMFDVGRGHWSTEVLDAVSEFVPWLSDVTFSRPVPCGTAVGEMSAAAAERLGLAVRSVLVAGAHDQVASAIGAGGHPGRVSTFALGSSDCLTVCTRERPPGLTGTGFATYPWRPGRWVTLAGTAAGGWSLDWYARLTGTSEPEAVLSAPSAEPPRVIVLPYLAGSGTLDNDPDGRGAIVGLTLDSTRDELTRAFLESAGYELGSIVAAFRAADLDVGDVRAVGSGAGAGTLPLRASAAGIPLTPGPRHASARGAALLAGVAVGRYPLGELPPPELGRRIEPDPTSRDWYTSQRRAYRELYAALRPFDRHLAGLLTEGSRT